MTAFHVDSEAGVLRRVLLHRARPRPRRSPLHELPSRPRPGLKKVSITMKDLLRIADVIDGPRSIVLDEAENGTHAAQALLLALFLGQLEGSALTAGAR